MAITIARKQIPATLSALCISTLLFLMCWHISMLVAEEYSYSESSEVRTGRYWRGQTRVSSSSLAVLKAEAAIAAKTTANTPQFPQKIWQLWKNGPADHLAATTELSSVWRAVNHGYRYERFTKETGIVYVESALQTIVRDDEEQDDIIQKLECMDEKDPLFEEFLKYLVLAVDGGAWVDVDAVPLTPVSSWAATGSSLQHDDNINHLNLVLAIETTSRSSVHFSSSAILAKPNHPAILEILMSTMDEIRGFVCSTTQPPAEPQQDKTLSNIELTKRWALSRRSISNTNEDKEDSKNQHQQDQRHSRPIRVKHVRPGHPLYDVSAGTYLETDESLLAVSSPNNNNNNNNDNNNDDDTSPSSTNPQPHPQIIAAYSPKPSSQKPLLDNNKSPKDNTPNKPTPSPPFSNDRLTIVLLSHLFRHHDPKFENDNVQQLSQTRDPTRVGDVLILPSGMGFDTLTSNPEEGAVRGGGSTVQFVPSSTSRLREAGEEVKSTSIVFHPKPLLVLAEDEEL